MNIEKEIQRIAEYQNALLPYPERKNEQSIKDIVTFTISAYNSEKYDFSNYTKLKLRQFGKHRKVVRYSSFSSEELLCIYIKRLLDRKFHVTYPNRNTFTHSLFDITCALKDMSDYTIFKFDFEDFFNSVSSIFVYRKYMLGKKLEREQEQLLEAFVNATKYAYAGLNTSNIICEIIAKQFDELLLRRLVQYGVIFYRRYIDDGILIFNRYISQDDCLEIIDGVIDDIFYDQQYTDIPQCKTRLNSSKTKYIARRNLSIRGGPVGFDFLGYEFLLTLKQNKKEEKTDFQYGITQAKIDKYTKRLNSIVKGYTTSPQKDMELLRHQIKVFTHRTVYRISSYKSIIWKNKGFISNYCELRYRMDALTPKTKDFLENAVVNAFIANEVPLPYFLHSSHNESIYSLFNNMKKYRTLLFVELIGISKTALKRMCTQVGINTNPGKEYDDLVRDYLIKVKVGH